MRASTKNLLVVTALVVLVGSLAAAQLVPVRMVPTCPAKVWCEYSYRDANSDLRLLLATAGPLISGALIVAAGVMSIRRRADQAGRRGPLRPEDA